MAGNTIISSSIEVTHSIMVNSPVFGSEKIIDGMTKKGLSKQTYVIAVDVCDSGSTNALVGADCKIFGEDMSGDCVVVSKQTSSIGGTSARPYIQETISVIGVSNG